MTAKATNLKTVALKVESVAKKPPRLNERVYIGEYNASLDIQEAAGIIRSCGLVAEVEAASAYGFVRLYAVRRRVRRTKKGAQS